MEAKEAIEREAKEVLQKAQAEWQAAQQQLDDREANIQQTEQRLAESQSKARFAAQPMTTQMPLTPQMPATQVLQPLIQPTNGITANGKQMASPQPRKKGRPPRNRSKEDDKGADSQMNA